MKLFKRDSRIRHYAQRGATMVSTTLLSVSLLSASMLLVRQATRNSNESGAVVARERALLAAQGAAQLAAAYYREKAEVDETILDIALTGSNNPGTQNKCTELSQDCIPGNALTNQVPTTGQRNELLTGKSDCSGRPCMRPGAVVMLDDIQGATIPWVRTQMSQLVQGGDEQATVTVWIRNNMSEALGEEGSWLEDEDFSIVITSMAEVHGAVVTIEQEFKLLDQDGLALWEMPSPELGYGGGHNNDSVAVETCADGMLARQRKQSSVLGHLLDFLMDEVKAMMIFACVTIRLALQHPEEYYLFYGMGFFFALSTGLTLTSFMRRPEYSGETPTEDGQPAVIQKRKGPIGAVLTLLEHSARFVVHYPQYIWLCAALDRMDIYFWAYGAVNVLYIGRAGLAILWRLGRFEPR